MSSTTFSGARRKIEFVCNRASNQNGYFTRSSVPSARALGAGGQGRVPDSADHPCGVRLCSVKTTDFADSGTKQLRAVRPEIILAKLSSPLNSPPFPTRTPPSLVYVLHARPSHPTDHPFHNSTFPYFVRPDYPFVPVATSSRCQYRVIEHDAAQNLNHLTCVRGSFAKRRVREHALVCPRISLWLGSSTVSRRFHPRPDHRVLSRQSELRASIFGDRQKTVPPIIIVIAITQR